MWEAAQRKNGKIALVRDGKPVEDVERWKQAWNKLRELGASEYEVKHVQKQYRLLYLGETRAERQVRNVARLHEHEDDWPTGVDDEELREWIDSRIASRDFVVSRMIDENRIAYFDEYLERARTS